VDVVGAFAVTAGIGADALAARFEAELDDLPRDPGQALADRLAEAFADGCTRGAARSGATASDEPTSRSRIASPNAYRGIRPRFGYPACPDHSEKPRLFALLEHQPRASPHRALRMLPAASVSGLYFAHQSRANFTLADSAAIRSRQYARRQGECRSHSWSAGLAPSLGYEPEGRA